MTEFSDPPQGDHYEWLEKLLEQNREQVARPFSLLMLALAGAFSDFEKSGQYSTQKESMRDRISFWVDYCMRQVDPTPTPSEKVRARKLYALFLRAICRILPWLDRRPRGQVQPLRPEGLPLPSIRRAEDHRQGRPSIALHRPGVRLGASV